MNLKKTLGVISLVGLTMITIDCSSNNAPSNPSNGRGGNNSPTPTITATPSATPTATYNVLITCNVSNGGAIAQGSVTQSATAGTVYGIIYSVTDTYGDELYDLSALMGASAAGSLRMAVFDDRGPSIGPASGPGNLLVQSPFVAAPASPARADAQNFNPIYLSPGNYWFALQSNNSSVSLTYSPGSPNGAQWTDSSFAGSTLINSPSASSNSNNYALAFSGCASTIFGNAVTTGGSNASIPTSSSGVTANFAASSFTLSQYAIVHSLGVYLVSGFTGPGGGLLIGLYSDNGGIPGTLLAHTGGAAGSIAETNRWVTLPIPDTPLAAGTYWTAFEYFSNTPGTSWTFYSQTGGNSVTGQFYDGGGLIFPANPTGLTAVSGSVFASYAIYNH